MQGVGISMASRLMPKILNSCQELI